MKEMSKGHKEGLEDAGSAYFGGLGGLWGEKFTDAMRAYLGARGLALVPREPTGDMKRVFDEYHDMVFNSASPYRCAHTMKAVIDAAPDPFKEE